MRRADASAPAELLLDEERTLWEVTYSPDGEWLVYRAQEAGAPNLYALRLGMDSVPVPLVVTEFFDSEPAVSPDGRWLAYRSSESGRSEVYVRPFPNTSSGRWLVSTDGGQSPMWAHSGRELFYREPNNLMSVEVLSGPTFVYGEPRALFPVVGIRSSLNHPQYDITPDDQRFVMIRNFGGEETDELIVVENFFEELKAKVGN